MLKAFLKQLKLNVFVVGEMHNLLLAANTH